MNSFIAILSKKDRDVTLEAIEMIEALEIKHSDRYAAASAKRVIAEYTLENLRKSHLGSSAVLGCSLSRPHVNDIIQPVKLRNATMVYDGKIYSDQATKIEEKFEPEKTHRHLEEAAADFIRENNGDYAFAVTDPETMVGGRDVMGARPLYWGENQDFSALASNRKALWRIGIKKTNSFPTGSVATLGSEGFKFKIVRSIVYSQEKQVTRQVAARKLEKLLQWSVKQRLLGVKEVAVAFSGGLDSSIVALLAGNIGIEVLLIHVALEGEAETDFAKEAAEQLKLPLCIRLCTERDVKRSMREVIRIAEDYDPVKVSIGIPIYFVAEKAAGMNCELLLAGQGADELFGGYKRYADEYVSQGNECVQETIFHDIVHIGEANLERDCKICKHFDVELRLPFATPEITDFAIKLPLELKMERKKNTLRKLILRQVAWNLKLPTDIVDRPKRAIQYSTGVSKVVRKIVRQNRMTTTEYFGRIFKDIFREVESEKNH